MDRILKGLDRTYFKGNLDVEIEGVAINSKDVVPGGLFIAIRGSKTDGNSFIQDAVFKGARVVVSEALPDKDFGEKAVWITVPDARKAAGVIAGNFYGNPTKSLEIVGITGTNGKTTTSYLLESIMNSSGRRVGVIGTINTRFGGKSVDSSNTTPDAVTLQRIFKEMADSGVSSVAIEVSSHALSQKRISGCSINGAIFTNLSRDHLDYHESMDDYFKAKEELFTVYMEESEKEGKFSIINVDDEKGAHLKSISKGRNISYGVLSGNSDFNALDIKTSLSGTSFVMEFFGKSIGIHTKLVGLHNVYNILAASAAGYALGIDAETIRAGVEKVDKVPGRFEALSKGQPFLVIVDYAHTDDALTNLLSSVSGLNPRKIIVVFGAGGDRDKGKRPRMAKAVEKFSDIAFITDDNPRTEDPDKIIMEIEKGFERFKKVSKEECGEKSAYTVIRDRREAIQKAISIAEQGDAVVVAGKGHEDYQIIGKDIFHFSDSEEVLKALENLGYND